MKYSSLSNYNVGSIVHVEEFGVDTAMSTRMAELGLTQKTPITIISNDNKGTLILCRSSKIMIGRKLSEKIQVSEV